MRPRPEASRPRPSKSPGAVRGLGSRSLVPTAGSATRPTGYGGGSRPSASYGGSSLRPSSYWGGYGSSYYAPYSTSYYPYYTSYAHCSPWSLGYYGSRFSFNFGGWFYPYGFYYSSYRNYRSSYWSPFNYSYCLPSYYSVVYVTQSYDAAVGDHLAPAPALEEVIEEPATVAPAPAPLDAAADRFITLGDTAFGEGRYSDAVQLYAKAVEYAPEEASLYLVLADALFASGDYHYAAYVIRKALDLDPLLANTQVDKHEFYADPSTLDQQLAVLESFLIRHPIDRDARLVLALNNLFSARPAAAVDLLLAPQASGLSDDPAAKLILQAAQAIEHGQLAD